jgi:hypothetical protein
MNSPIEKLLFPTPNSRLDKIIQLGTFLNQPPVKA